MGILGAKNLDLSDINAKYGFVLDLEGEIGYAAISAPTQNTFDIKIIGKAAHVGIEPEKGISAIQIAADAISNMKLEEWMMKQADVGTIKGGEATNIVCEEIEIRPRREAGIMKS